MDRVHFPPPKFRPKGRALTLMIGGALRTFSGLSGSLDRSPAGISVLWVAASRQRKQRRNGAEVETITPDQRAKWPVLSDGTATALEAYLHAPTSVEVTHFETTFGSVVVGRPAKPGFLRRRSRQMMTDRC
jgi:hypothetical protein